MRRILTLNFKGGVGKTTMTFLLAKYCAQVKGKKTLVFDLDPQMNLTYLMLFDGRDASETEAWKKRYAEYEKSPNTVTKAMVSFVREEGLGMFPVGDMFLPVAENMNFLPAVMQLYWFDILNRKSERLDGFIDALLDKVMDVPELADAEYVIFDAPPSITYLTISTICACTDIVIPIIPHILSARGLGLILSAMRTLKLSSYQTMLIFLNKAREYKLKLSSDCEKMLDYARKTAAAWQPTRNGPIIVSDRYIRESADIGRISLKKDLPADIVSFFDEIIGVGQREE